MINYMACIVEWKQPYLDILVSFCHTQVMLCTIKMPVIPLIVGAFFWWIFIIGNIPVKCGQRPQNPLVEISGLWWILAAQITTNQRISTYICIFRVTLEWWNFSMIWLPRLLLCLYIKSTVLFFLLFFFNFSSKSWFFAFK